MRSLAAIGVVAALFACAHVPTPAEEAARRELARRFVVERAGFDMKCDASKLNVAYLGDAPSTKFGARGCDQECIYKMSCDTAGKCEVLEAECGKTPTTTPPTTEDSTAPKKETP